MRQYFNFLSITLIKKWTLLLASILFWLFIFMLIDFVPWLLGFSALSLWNNTAMDIQPFLLVIISVLCSVIVVGIFRDGRDDGTELIVISKPLERWKVIFVKFLTLFAFSSIIVAFGIVLMCGGFLNNHTSAVEMFKSIASFTLASLVLIFVFSGIAVLFSLFAGKVGIMVWTIGIGIILNIIHMAWPLLAKEPRDYIENQGVTCNSASIIDAGNGVSPNIVAQPIVYTDTNVNDTPTDFLSYLNSAKKHDSSAAFAYSDFGGQLSSMYHSLNGTDNSSFSDWGSSQDYSYKVTNQNTTIYDKITAPGSTYSPLASIYWGRSYGKYRLGMSVAGGSATNGASLLASAIGGIGKDSALWICDSTNLFEGIKYVPNSCFYTINDPDYVNYIFDKYVWWGGAWESEFGYTIPEASKNVYWEDKEDPTVVSADIFPGLSPNEWWVWDEKHNIAKSHIAYVLSQLLVYDNSPSIDGTNWNRVSDTWDADKVPDFNKNTEIGWGANPATDWVMHSDKSEYSGEIAPHMIDALGPYPSDFNDNEKVTLAMAKLKNILATRYSNMFWHPNRYAFDYGEEGLGIAMPLGSEPYPGYINIGKYYLPEYDENNSLVRRAFDDNYIINAIINKDEDPDEPKEPLMNNIIGLMEQRSSAGLINGLSPIPFSDYRHDEYKKRERYTNEPVENNISGFISLSTAREYNYHKRITGLDALIVWGCFSLALFGLSVYRYCRTDFK